MSLIAIYAHPFPVLKRLSSTRILHQCLKFKHCIHYRLSSCSPHMPKPKVIVISGPTASGKTNLGLHLAKLLDGEVVSADSVQVRLQILFFRICSDFSPLKHSACSY